MRTLALLLSATLASCNAPKPPDPAVLAKSWASNMHYTIDGIYCGAGYLCTLNIRELPLPVILDCQYSCSVRELAWRGKGCQP